MKPIKTGNPPPGPLGPVPQDEYAVPVYSVFNDLSPGTKITAFALVALTVVDLAAVNCSSISSGDDARNTVPNVS